MSGPLSREDLAVLGAAEHRARTIRRASRVAVIDAWFLAVGAVVCLPLAYFSAWSLLAAAALAGFAFVEFRGARSLRAFDPMAPRTLALNQLVLLALVVLYCALRIHGELAGPGFYARFSSEYPDAVQQLRQADDPALGGMGGEILMTLEETSALMHIVVLVVYSAVIVLSILFQGLLALYYWRRRPVIEAYLAGTPPWVLELQRRTTA